MSKDQPEKPPKSSRRIERILALVALAAMIWVWVMGGMRSEESLMPFYQETLSEAVRLEHFEGETYVGWDHETGGEIIAYLTTGAANGYGGILQLIVAVTPTGEVKDITVVDHKETKEYFDRVINKDFLGLLSGKTYKDSFVLGEDVVAVSGATYTSRAISDSVRQAVRQVAQNQLNLELPAAYIPEIKFGFPEIVLIGLYGVGFVGINRRFKFTKIARWMSLVVGLLVLGFMYNSPLTLAFVNKLLLGYWPEWQTNLYWYLLTGGVLLVLLADNKNHYCDWFCPFGAAQECIGAIGGAQVHNLGIWRGVGRWTPRLLALTAILMALFFRNPGISSYEVFGTLFSFVGSSSQFFLLGLVMTVSLFITRPWCSYLCPMRPVVDYLKLMRSWMVELWRKIRTKSAL